MRILKSLMALSLGCSAAVADTNGANPSSTVTQAVHISVQELKSKGGLTAWLVQNKDIPVVSVSVAFRHAGSKSDPYGKSGLTQILADVLQEGAGELKSRDFHKKLLEKNIQFTIRSNRDAFYISFRTIKENAVEALKLVRLILSQPRFDEDALSRVKNQLLTSLNQGMHSERQIAEITAMHALYPNHPYGITAAESIKQIPSITAQDLRTFIKDRLTRDQLVVTSAGDISPETLTAALDATFEVLPESGKKNEIPHIVPQNLGKVLIERMPIPQSMIMYVQKGLPRTDPDFYTTYILIEILGDGSFESRLWNEIREKRGLAYGVDTNVSWHNHSETIVGATATQNKNVSQVVSIIRTEWERMKKEGPTQAELDFVKQRLLGSFALNFASTQHISEALLQYQLDNLGSDFINKRNDLIRAVTLEQVQAAAKKILHSEDLTFIIVGNPEVEKK